MFLALGQSSASALEAGQGPAGQGSQGSGLTVPGSMVVADGCHFATYDTGGSRAGAGGLGGAVDALFSTYFVCGNAAPDTGLPMPVHCGPAMPVAGAMPASTEGMESLDRWQLEHGQNPGVNDDIVVPSTDQPRWREPVSVSSSAPPGAIRTLAAEGADDGATACT